MRRARWMKDRVRIIVLLEVIASPSKRCATDVTATWRTILTPAPMFRKGARIVVMMMMGSASKRFATIIATWQRTLLITMLPNNSSYLALVFGKGRWRRWRWAITIIISRTALLVVAASRYRRNKLSITLPRRRDRRRRREQPMTSTDAAIAGFTIRRIRARTIIFGIGIVGRIVHEVPTPRARISPTTIWPQPDSIVDESFVHHEVFAEIFVTIITAAAARTVTYWISAAPTATTRGLHYSMVAATDWMVSPKRQGGRAHLSSVLRA
mmetsp:Transcript_43659/g.91850  ORF Transcript_43659/g.91850 Transcript_43659/m.91850 type:complete len:268 (+) Transcript_43659:2392-3195(+)